MRRGNAGHVGPRGMSRHADTEDMLLHVAAAKRRQAEQMQPKKRTIRGGLPDAKRRRRITGKQAAGRD